jgi:hypothetical protein
MATNTRRDAVWTVILNAVVDGVSHDVPERAFESHIPDGIIASDITPQVEATKRTVQGVLATMAQSGLLDVQTERVYVRTPSGHEVQATKVYTASESGPFRRLADADAIEPETPGPNEESDTETSEETPRYVIDCPDCEYSTTRDQNSPVVKGTRRRKRLCPECEARLELSKDNRPDPPICPKCGEEALAVTHHEGGAKTYVHDYGILETGAGAFREVEGCFGD